jgi:hypothetical protein
MKGEGDVKSRSSLSTVLVVAVMAIGAFLSSTAATAYSVAGVRSREEGPTSTLAVVSKDPYANPGTYHRTQVEPDSAAFGSTIVSVFQTGRSYEWGASNLGWSVSSDAGATWTDGFLPGTTIHATPPGRWKRVVDPVVAYDAKHDTWLIQGIGIRSCSLEGTCGRSGRMFVSRSTDDAQTFTDPILLTRADRSQGFDRESIACDNFPASPFYGNCYTAWSDFGLDFRPDMVAYTSSDGGMTWTKAITPKGRCPFIPLPVVQPSGNVVIPFANDCKYTRHAFISTDGGASYSGSIDLPSGDARAVAGHLRSGGSHSFDVDEAGTIYGVWPDCTFRSFQGRYCTHNDIVFSTSEDGRHWSDLVRIPIDPVTSSVDHFLPALAVDPATAGSSAHIGIVYYFYPEQHCEQTTCQLSVGFVSSTDGGSTWTSPLQLAGPFKNTWFPLTTQGYMVGDYISMSIVDGKAIPVFPVATKGRCDLGEVTSCNVWTASATIPLGTQSSRDDRAH